MTERQTVYVDVPGMEQVSDFGGTGVAAVVSPFELTDKVDQVTGEQAQAARAPRADLPPSMREIWDEAHKSLARHIERRDAAQAEANAALKRATDAAMAVRVASKVCALLEATYKI